MSTIREARLEGGTPLCEGCSEMECKHRCLHNHESCAAVDYNSQVGTCYMHPEEEVCETLMSAQGFIHYRRIPCVSFFPQIKMTTSQYPLVEAGFRP